MHSKTTQLLLLSTVCFFVVPSRAAAHPGRAAHDAVPSHRVSSEGVLAVDGLFAKNLFRKIFSRNLISSFGLREGAQPKR